MSCQTTVLPSSSVTAWSYFFIPMFSTHALNSHCRLSLLPWLEICLSLRSSKLSPNLQVFVLKALSIPIYLGYSLITFGDISHLKILDFWKANDVDTYKVLVFFFPLVWPFADSLLTNTPKLEHQILHWFWQVCMWQFHSLWFLQIIKHSFELSRLRTVAKVFYLNWKK